VDRHLPCDLVAEVENRPRTREERDRIVELTDFQKASRSRSC